MEGSQFMATATSDALLLKKRKHAFAFEEELCNAGVGTAWGESGVLDVPGRLHFQISV